MIASFTSLEAGERDLRLEREAFELERADAERVEERHRLARPGAMVQLVERDDRALRHARDEPLDRALRRLVEIEVEIQQRDDQMRIALQVVGNRRQRIALDQLDLRDVAERAIEIEDRRALRDVVGGVGGEAAG